MGRRDNLDLEKHLNDAIENIENDRAIASDLLVDLMQHIKADQTKHQYSGPVAAKYLETLQRSNEQLVKIASLIQKKDSSSQGLTKFDKEEIYSILEEDKDKS